MPAPTQVTPEQVQTAAAQLTGRGERITGWSLRRVIGAGNPARLEGIWREQATPAAPQVSAAQDSPPLPPTVGEHLAAAKERVAADLDGIIMQSWKAAADLAARRVQEEVQAARDRVTELNDEQAEAQAALQQADERIETLTVERDSAQATMLAMRAEVARDLKAEGEARARAEAMAEAATARADAAETRAAAAEERADRATREAMERMAQALASAPAQDTPRRRVAPRDDEARVARSA